MSNKNYEVTISETLKMKVTVGAESAQEAEEIVKDRWKNGDYILDADNFIDVEFKAKFAKDRDHGR